MERDDELTEQALIYLMRHKKRQIPHSLLKTSSRQIYCMLVELMECSIRNEENICFCESYHGCAPYRYSDKIYACESYQLIYDFYPYY